MRLSGAAAEGWNSCWPSMRNSPIAACPSGETRNAARRCAPSIRSRIHQRIAERRPQILGGAMGEGGDDRQRQHRLGDDHRHRGKQDPEVIAML